MSYLIDSFMSTTTEVRPGLWAIAKPLPDLRWKFRIRNAWKVLTCRAVAVHFAVDEIAAEEGA